MNVQILPQRSVVDAIYHGAFTCESNSQAAIGLHSEHAMSAKSEFSIPPAITFPRTESRDKSEKVTRV